MAGPITLGALAVVGLLASEGCGWRPGVWLFKPLASAAFLWAALAWGALGTGYGRLIFTALALGALGDVLLIPQDRRVFVLGLVAFIFGHAAFIAAFMMRPLSFEAVGLAAFVAAFAGRAALRWLKPHLPESLVPAVTAYVIVLTLMMAAAAGASLGTGRVAPLIGAWMFAVSDVAVARWRFGERRFAEAAWGLPLYFAAQFVLASTVA